MRKMIIEFPGTKGEIEEASSIHKYHSSLIIKERNTAVLVDFGVDYNPWLMKVVNNFSYILITHAHPDHYIWTVEKENRITIPVFLTIETLNYGKYYPLNYRIIERGKEYILKNFKITACDVIHSLRCPAVAYKIKGARSESVVLYAPDILDFEDDKEKVLNGVDLFIADGSSLSANMVRRSGDKLFGHARVKTIAGWCKKYGVKELIITHCGKQIVTMDESELAEKLEEYSEGKINIRVAHDDWVIKL